MAVTIAVETGSNVPNANSYQSVSDWKLYADQRGWDYSGKSDDQIRSALIVGTSWVDATYRSRWPGVRTYGSEQSLMWPRRNGIIVYGQFVSTGPLTTVTDSEGMPIANDAIPQALISATAEAAYRELVEPGSLSPDLERGGAVRRLQAGSVSIEYAGTAPTGTTFSIIDGLLSSIIITGQSATGFTARAVRA